MRQKRKSIKALINEELSTRETISMRLMKLKAHLIVL
jgi:hypothetical protein